MDTQVEKCIEKVEEFEGFGVRSSLPKQTSVSKKWGNLSGFGATTSLSKEEVYILKVEEFEGILCNDLGTPVKFTKEVSDVLYKSIHATSTSSTTITTKQPTTNI